MHAGATRTETRYFVCLRIPTFRIFAMIPFRPITTSMKHIFLHLAVMLAVFALTPVRAASAEIPDFQFEQSPALSALPNNEVLTLLQDSDGFIWIATKGGLYKYDGYDIREYRSNLYNPELLSDNWVSALAEDRQKHLYIGTKDGLNVLDKKSGTVRQSKAAHFRHNYIAAIMPVSDNEIWTATNRGLILYDPTTDEARKTDFKPLRDGAVKGMLLDSNGEIWVGTWNKGLFRYSPKKDQWTKYPRFTPSNSIHVLFEDSQGRLWAGTFGEGLILIENQYDPENTTVTRFTSDMADGLSDDFIYAIAENIGTGTLWIGTRKGISISQTHVTEKIRWKKYYSNTLIGNDVDALINDRQGNIWIGTLSGINYVRTSKSGFRSNPLTATLNVLKSSSATSILADNNGKIWTGIGANGISITDPVTGKEEIHHHFDWGRKSHKFSMIPYLLQSKTTGDILLGTVDGIYVQKKGRNSTTGISTSGNIKSKILKITEIESKGYLICGTNTLGFLDFSLENFQRIEAANHEYSCGLKYDADTFFIGSSSNGIFKVRCQGGSLTGKTQICSSYNIENGRICSDNITDLFVDSRHRMWAATDGGGLCLYDEEHDRFISVNTLMDFPTDIVTSIIEDHHNTLWIGTNIGLIRFFPETDIAQSSFRIYDENNGLPDKSFNPRSVSKSADGTIYFGCHRGYVYFNPDDIQASNEFPEVMVTDIKLDNRSISQFSEKDLRKTCNGSPEYTYELNVGSRFNSLTISFAPMIYTMPNKVRYAYRLEGFDNDWQYTDYRQRFAHYANLDPGRYTFRLKTTNESGLWNDYTRDMEIRILPPVWKTWWAYVLYLLFGSALVWLFYRSARQRLRYRNKIRMQQAENERNVELNQAKLRFFTNITHELFTPITIISAATEELKSQIPEQEYGVISSNIDRLTRLIQQILEFRKAETGNLRLQVSNRNLPRFIAKNIESFGPLMKHKHIRITYCCDEKNREAFFDADKIDKILYNLLSNALKYNKEGAEVIVSLSFSDDGEYATFTVEDNGEGLSERTMKNLFKRFYDGDFRKFNTYGTGIGLSLVNDLVKLHKGTIEVDNRPGNGVKFTVTIPVTINHYSEEECDEIRPSHTDPAASQAAAQDKPLYRLLVVEDNPDLNFVLKNMLARNYEVFSAENGAEALEIIRKEDIDLIVSDVMMPVMDGYELCSKVKNDMEFSHIQIILLTAKTEDEDVVEAYKVGADAYIPKPFSVKRLNARISNLLEARQKRIETFRKQLADTSGGFNFQTLEYTSHDEKFLKDVIRIINENYTNPEFDQNMLLEKLGVSKSTLHRKLTSLTGSTASIMIKDARLKAAYELLKKKDGPMVSEIAYAVGFNDPKYFSSCFKKEFGMLPSEVERGK